MHTSDDNNDNICCCCCQTGFFCFMLIITTTDITIAGQLMLLITWLCCKCCCCYCCCYCVRCVSCCAPKQVYSPNWSADDHYTTYIPKTSVYVYVYIYLYVLHVHVCVDKSHDCDHAELEWEHTQHCLHSFPLLPFFSLSPWLSPCWSPVQFESSSIAFFVFFFCRRPRVDILIEMFDSSPSHKSQVTFSQSHSQSRI